MATGSVHPSISDNVSTLFIKKSYSYNWMQSIRPTDPEWSDIANGRINLAANKFSPTVSTPSGYRVVGIASFRAGCSWWGVAQINPNATGTGALMTVREWLGTDNMMINIDPDNDKAIVEILYARTEFCS